MSRFDLGGTRVNRLTKTEIIFWNSGNAILRGSDLVESDPLRFDFPDKSIVVDFKISKYSRTANNFMASIDSRQSNSVEISFDYLDPNDGAKIDILHTSSTKSPQAAGVIRGVPKVARDWGPQASRLEVKLRRLRRRTSKLTVVLVGSIGLIGLVYSEFVLIFAPPWHRDTAWMPPLAVVSVLYLGLGWMDWRRTRRRYPKSLRAVDLEPE
jgi:hypothetical protein